MSDTMSERKTIQIMPVTDGMGAVYFNHEDGHCEWMPLVAWALVDVIERDIRTGEIVEHVATEVYGLVVQCDYAVEFADVEFETGDHHQAFLGYTTYECLQLNTIDWGKKSLAKWESWKKQEGITGATL